ncbi:group III truncated hemoglobin [Aerosticca soli]|uniref:Truncated hemoglobins n=1 Tax=Aerosticca soli TaxID=2010829 RepID=A0A2Z6E6M4_9GAMM|nr:group III truncated hemoglobin [Aerosticca soli]BBD80753.1 truncated hemoglobins [Aerosticca soli]
MLDQAAIARLVARFYGIVRADALLGPIFAATVKDWPEHERRLTAFWCTVALRGADDRPTYHGSPMAAHRPLPIDDAHFEHWLTLWRETCRAQLDAEDAAKLIGYAEGIARGLRYGLGLRGRRLVPRIDRPPA